MIRNKVFPFLIFVPLAVLALSCDRIKQSEEGEDSLEEEHSEIHLAYSLEVEDEGETRKVAEDYRFRSGDRFRLVFRPSFSAYLYIFHRGPGAEGYGAVFPNPAIERINPIGADVEMAIPAKEGVWLTMDDVGGDEQMVIVASNVAIPALQFDDETVGQESFESNLAKVERQFKAESSRRFEDEDWVKLFAGGQRKEMAIVLRLFLRHEE